MKARNIIFAVCIFLAVVLQNTLLDYIKIFGVKPNLLIIFVITIAFLFGNVQGAVAGFFVGLSQDITSGKMLGFYALSGLYLGLIVGVVNKRLYRDNFLVVVFFTFVSTIAYEVTVYLVHEWGVYLFNSLSGNRLDVVYAIRSIVIPEAIYNSIISIPIYVITSRINDRFENAGKTIRRY